jgi:hypothetical protein
MDKDAQTDAGWTSMSSHSHDGEAHEHGHEHSGAGYSEGADRSAEEVAWDKEFAEPKQNDILSGIGEIAKLAVQVPVTIVTLPFRIIPEETGRHSRAAVRESFLAVRSLLGAVGDGIERLLADPQPRETEEAVPDGTWGNRMAPRNAQSSQSTGGKARRIPLSDDGGTTTDMEQESRSAMTASEREEDKEVGEGRGLRADIEY